MQLTLSAGETDELRRLIAVALADLRSEIHHTDTPDYRKRLQERERILSELEGRLAGADAGMSG